MRLLRPSTLRPDQSTADNIAAAEAAHKFPRSRMSGRRRRLGLAATTICVTVGTSLLVALAPGVAQASPPVGTCTKSYTELTYDQVGMLPDGALAQSVFNVVNANGDAFVCYKPYPNGPHNGHYGNFVDNTAAPHQ
jgi:hypothetical protein